MKTKFEPNVDLMTAFNSKVMLINDIQNSENGITFIKARADGPPIHLHQEQEEHFKILEGTLEVYLKDRWHQLQAGDEIFIPKQTHHTYRSRGNEDCLFAYCLTPKMNFSIMMKNFETLIADGKLKGPKDLKSIIHLAMVFDKYKSEVKSVTPPPFIMSTMALIGKGLGYKV